MKHIFIILALFLFTPSFADSLNKIVVFGDSLSDNGNLYEYMKHELPLSPPYFKGRFTNGPVWIEILTSLYYPVNPQAHLLDYAFGGAGVSEEIDEDDEDEVLFTLRREVDSYLISHQDKADENSLYVIWMGSNNYLGVPDDVDAAVNEVTLGIKHDVERLVKKGATHIMLVGVPNLGRTPAAVDFDAVNQLTLLSAKHNQVLKQYISDVTRDYPAVHWFYFDASGALDEVMDSPLDYGFTNITDTCYEDMSTLSSSKPSVLKMVSNIKINTLNDACTGHLFFDQVHPSGPAHKMMAERTKKMLDEAGVVFESIA